MIITMGTKDCLLKKLREILAICQTFKPSRVLYGDGDGFCFVLTHQRSHSITGITEMPLMKSKT